jgi:hypothetical protein
MSLSFVLEANKHFSIGFAMKTIGSQRQTTTRKLSERSKRLDRNQSKATTTKRTDLTPGNV